MVGYAHTRTASRRVKALRSRNGALQLTSKNGCCFSEQHEAGDEKVSGFFLCN